MSINDSDITAQRHNSLGQIKAIPKALQNMKSQISQTNNADVRKETDQGFANLS